MRRLDCHGRLKQVENSYQTALQTVTVLIGFVEKQPQLRHDHQLDLSAMRTLVVELHDIYFARLFASFESSLRDYWRTAIKDTKPMTAQLLSAIAARRGVEQDTLNDVHEIREFRNYLIHEEHEVKRRFTLEEASRILNKYLARLPLEW